MRKAKTYQPAHWCRLIRVFAFFLNPFALRTAKTLLGFDCSECNKVKDFSRCGIAQTHTADSAPDKGIRDTKG